MYWLRWHYHVKDIAGAPYKIKKKERKKRKKTKQQNHRQSVVAGRQQLYCAVQSRSPNHSQTTTGLVAASDRTRAKHQFKFRAVGSSTQAFCHSSAVRTVGDWNSLPSHVVEQSTAASFALWCICGRHQPGQLRSCPGWCRPHMHHKAPPPIHAILHEEDCELFVRIRIRIENWKRRIADLLQ